VIRPVRSSDAGALAEIYNHYVLNTVVSFEELPVAAEEMALRIDRNGAAGWPWLVAEAEGGAPAGYAYAGPWQVRCAYQHTVELTIYLSPRHAGAGLGTRLYGQLFEALRDTPAHTAIGAIALPNPASVALHEKFGMTRVGQFREVGFKFGRWIDVGYWQVVLDG